MVIPIILTKWLETETGYESLRQESLRGVNSVMKNIISNRASGLCEYLALTLLLRPWVTPVSAQKIRVPVR